MSAKRTSKKPGKVSERPRQPSYGRADFARIDAMTEEDIERTSPPELKNLPPDFWDSAVLVLPYSKTPISLRVDDDVLAWFRARGPMYQSRMNAVLRSYMNGVEKRKPKARAKRR